MANQLQNLIINPASSFWGAAVKDATKVEFATASTAFLQSAGIKVNPGNVIDPASLKALSPTDQAMLFLNFYDTLMGFSGKGHVDWWMGATGWSPALAATAGAVLKGDTPVSVGMIDFTVSSSAKNAKGSLLQLGSNIFSNGHAQPSAA